MPVTRTINTLNTINPAAIRSIREAFEDAVRRLETRQPLCDLPDSLRASLARQIVELAREGERDVDRLRDGALAALDHAGADWSRQGGGGRP